LPIAKAIATTSGLIYVKLTAARLPDGSLASLSKATALVSPATYWSALLAQ
jgi:hypothetical protein